MGKTNRFAKNVVGLLFVSIFVEGAYARIATEDRFVNIGNAERSVKIVVGRLYASMAF
jgi:hypothetical protein